MFHFKQFSLSDKSSAMKIGTDSVLLGSWVDIGNAATILDIGTGSGILALMMAQRSTARIEAMDIDPVSSREARLNVQSSPWKNRIFIHEISFQQFILHSDRKFDLIISNPPYFTKSMKPANLERSRSRHDDLLPMKELIAGTRDLLTSSGKAAFILPVDSFEKWLLEASLNSLHPARICRVFPRKGKPCKRLMIEFKMTDQEPAVISEMIIREINGHYSDSYKKLTRGFYLGLQ
jgi:tRNA1Val (adenine37-N6)-methyltransferase